MRVNGLDSSFLHCFLRLDSVLDFPASLLAILRLSPPQINSYISILMPGTLHRIIA